MASSALQIPAAIKSSSSAFSGRLPSTNNIGSSPVYLSVRKKWGLQVRGCSSCGAEDRLQDKGYKKCQWLNFKQVICSQRKTLGVLVQWSCCCNSFHKLAC